MREAWADILAKSFFDVLDRLAGYAPRLLAVLTLIALGWGVAIAARRLASRVLAAADVDGFAARSGITGALARTGLRSAPSDLVGQLVFWLCFLVALLMAIEALEVPVAAGLAPLVIRFLPNLLVALFVLLIGWLLANFLAQALLIFVVNAQLSGGPLVAGAVRWLVWAFAGGVALTQLGIAREMILLAFGIVFGGATLALSLAFGLAGRHLARSALEGWLARREGPADISHL